ncbi:hypothetical protein [Flavobacterium poyangense]|uniref:hypothetical protein n=1 Tax=Flavobacterium poyangense TaxID=2204302 RepID=UPI001424012F|nr:hypothetical protein [Flavobacterium sp. JXAS1]
MEYVTDGSSNSVTNGEALVLDIVISKKNSETILLKGIFTVEGIADIAVGDDLKNLSCELWEKADDGENASTSPVKICNLLHDPDNPNVMYHSIPKDYDQKYKKIELKIRAKKCTINSETAVLNITFIDQNVAAEVNFTVVAAAIKPEIIKFEASVTVLQSNKTVRLSWYAKGDKYILWEGFKKLKEGELKDLEESYTIDKIATGDHSYTLEVQRGNASVTQTIQVRALGESKFYSNCNPTGADSIYKIGNFCVSQDSSYLFSLMLKTENGKTQLDHIGYTNAIEGFSGNWNRILLSDTDKKVLEPFATSPLLHMKSTGELHGRLFFVGGSYVKPMITSNATAVVYLDLDLYDDSEKDKEKAKNRVKLITELSWSSRMGHACALFPSGDQEKIWLLGGVDEWGKALDDVWVSGDGETWTNNNTDGSVNENPKIPVKMPWKKRCLSGITVELKDNGQKKAIWFGGGFSEIGGTETSDIWKWEDNNWGEIKPLTINNSSYLSSGISFVGKDNVDSTGIFLLGGYQDNQNKKKYFYRVTLNNGNYRTDELDTSSGVDSLATTKQSKIVTGFFKGCMWYMVFTNEGDLGITYSNLFYWVQVATSRTLILS